MNTLVSALKNETNKTETENGMKAFKSSTNGLVDLFYKIGANRGEDLTKDFQKAFHEDVDTAVRIMLYSRDVREGMGERQHYRNALREIAIKDHNIALKLIPITPELGRWDDLFSLVGTPVENEMLSFYAKALSEGNALASKWAPREKSSKKDIAIKLMKALGVNKKQYRKMLVENTDVVESKMSNKDWSSISFSNVPSLAHLRYTNAFKRNDEDRYHDYLLSLEKGEEGVKINAGAVYPHQITSSILYDDQETVRIREQQWKALPDWITNDSSFLPVSDVSGSMTINNGLPLDVSISLGIYCAQRNKSAFKDLIISFSSDPTFTDISGLSLKESVRVIKESPWGMTTDLEKTFDLVLDTAVKNKVKQEDMPNAIIIFSDMQFNYALHGYRGYERGNFTAQEMIRNKYESSGYKMPKIVYWNLNGSSNVPVIDKETGALLVSGFSPSLMKSILSNQDYNPIEAILDIVGNDRYNWNK